MSAVSRLLDRAEWTTIFALTARVSAMAAVEAAVATAQGAAGDIPADAADGDRRGVCRPVGVEILADGWQVGTPVLGLARRAAVAPAGRARRSILHHGLTTQDVVDTATMMLVSDALRHLGDLAGEAAVVVARRSSSAPASVATQARSFLQPADVTTVGFRTARWLDQLDQVRRPLPTIDCRCNSVA